VFDIGKYFPDIYIDGMTLSYRGDGKTEYLRIGPGWNAGPNTLRRGYPIYAASEVEAEEELSIIRRENGTCKSSPRTLDENVRKWMICRAAFLQQPDHMYRQELVMELFNGWFDGAYESWRMSQGALGFDVELFSYVDEYKSLELASSTLFQRRLARYELLLREVNEADIKLFETAVSWASQGYPCYALKMLRAVKPRFIALSENYASSHINNVTLGHFEDAIVRWTGGCAQSDDEDSRISDISGSKT
jgi:hypothetical protein